MDYDDYDGKCALCGTVAKQYQAHAPGFIRPKEPVKIDPDRCEQCEEIRRTSPTVYEWVLRCFKNHLGKGLYEYL